MRTTRSLTHESLIDVKRFIQKCNRHEGLDLSFNLEIGPDSAGPNQFLEHDGETLVGIVSLQGGREIELCLAVHPDHRRTGLGRSLLKIARDEVKRRGRTHLLLVCEEISRSGRAFVKAVGAQYRLSEYRMRLDPREARTPQSARGTLHVRQAGTEDLDVLARLIASSFDRPAEDERARVASDMLRSSHRFFVAAVDGQPVGSLGVAATDRRAYIIAFNILPHLRRRGYGQQMLAHAVAVLRRESWAEILLEVATDNRDALSLYRSGGFHEVTSYGYYQIDL